MSIIAERNLLIKVEGKERIVKVLENRTDLRSEVIEKEFIERLKENLHLDELSKYKNALIQVLENYRDQLDQVINNFSPEGYIEGLSAYNIQNEHLLKLHFFELD